jgi:hypothetical protein
VSRSGLLTSDAENAYTKSHYSGQREGPPPFSRPIRPTNGVDLGRDAGFSSNSVHARRTTYLSGSWAQRPRSGRSHPSAIWNAVDEGSELGCHTFDHLDAWHTSSTAFIASVVRNDEALHRILPGARFTTFACPKSGAKLSLKSTLGNSFMCCRGGGQATNEDSADLNLLKHALSTGGRGSTPSSSAH